MTVMYFKATLEQIAASKASDCPMATPNDPRPCQGSACMYWNREANKPCQEYRTKS